MSATAFRARHAGLQVIDQPAVGRRSDSSTHQAAKYFAARSAVMAEISHRSPVATTLPRWFRTVYSHFSWRMPLDMSRERDGRRVCQRARVGVLIMLVVLPVVRTRRAQPSHRTRFGLPSDG